MHILQRDDKSLIALFTHDIRQHVISIVRYGMINSNLEQFLSSSELISHMGTLPLPPDLKKGASYLTATIKYPFPHRALIPNHSSILLQTVIHTKEERQFDLMSENPLVVSIILVIIWINIKRSLPFSLSAA
ncbi:hypothetical protein CEXT_469061 [Caerostris extrusa]|uniref:Uncharacterized protein n=1 Tax=Caerostris extrusa TaxID=172846 RepID=A0AAV4XP64_CAEEX|nr:hypothetical protein CEXT_469061 [Caerostris extrusa]